ncbi:MAG: hypothetical protein J1E97_05495, partial [Muribaculaceae bacterium]|nr:hypothetical protein [Muribaculaceae bacterium]
EKNEKTVLFQCLPRGRPTTPEKAAEKTIKGLSPGPIPGPLKREALPPAKPASKMQKESAPSAHPLFFYPYLFIR